MAKQVLPPGDNRRGLWGILGTLLRGPVDAFNPRQVAQGAQVIGRLTDIIRAGPQRDPRIQVEGSLVSKSRVQCTAEVHGSTPSCNRQAAQELAKSFYTTH